MTRNVTMNIHDIHHFIVHSTRIRITKKRNEYAYFETHIHFMRYFGLSMTLLDSPIVFRGVSKNACE